MQLVIKIRMDNAAFEDNPADEVTAILVNYLRKLGYGDDLARPLFDSNGNKVGTAEVTP